MAEDTNFENSQKLAPDAEITLFHLTTTGGTSVYFKSGPEAEYLGDTYESIPCGLTSEKKTAEGSPERPILTLGGDDINLAVLKPALFSGQVDGGTLTKHVVELQDMLANNNIKITTDYRIKQIRDYNETSVSLVLARFSPSSQTTIPFVKYTRPGFPHVQL